MIRSWCQWRTYMYMKTTKLYRLARSTVTKCDHERSEITLASCGRPSLPYISSCYCALALALCYSALSCGGHHKKVEGHSKNFLLPEIVPLHFQIASGATVYRD